MPETVIDIRGLSTTLGGRSIHRDLDLRVERGEVIALIACRMGLTVSRDARSVGAHTTSTVVQSLVAIILLNAIFAVTFVEMGI